MSGRDVMMFSFWFILFPPESCCQWKALLCMSHDQGRSEGTSCLGNLSENPYNASQVALVVKR